MAKNKKKEHQTEAMRRQNAGLPPIGKNFGKKKKTKKR